MAELGGQELYREVPGSGGLHGNPASRRQRLRTEKAHFVGAKTESAPQKRRTLATGSGLLGSPRKFTETYCQLASSNKNEEKKWLPSVRNHLCGSGFRRGRAPFFSVEDFQSSATPTARNSLAGTAVSPKTG